MPLPNQPIPSPDAHISRPGEAAPRHDRGRTDQAGVNPRNEEHWRNSTSPAHRSNLLRNSDECGPCRPIPLRRLPDAHALHGRVANPHSEPGNGAQVSQLHPLRHRRLSGEFQIADSIARQYINLFGLNNNLGVIDTTAGNQPFLGRELANGGSKLSEYSKSKIDREVASLIQFALNAAIDIIENNIHDFTDLAKLLLKKNTIDKRDLEKFNILYCDFF